MKRRYSGVRHSEGILELHEYLNFQFFLFGRSSNTNTITYSGRGRATAGANQTVEVIENAARKHIKDHARSNMDVRVIRVVEVFELVAPFQSYLTILQPRKSTLDEYDGTPRGLEEYDCTVNNDLGKVVLHATTTPLQEISAKDGLIIEFGL